MEFTLTTNIKALPETIYKAWLSSDGHSKMTGGLAKISDVPGEGFTAWEGYLWGENLELEPYKRIVQSWRSSDFVGSDLDSQIEVLLEEMDGGTLLTLIHSKVPDGGEHYFEPMKSYFALNNK